MRTVFYDLLAEIDKIGGDMCKIKIADIGLYGECSAHAENGPESACSSGFWGR